MSVARRLSVPVLAACLTALAVSVVLHVVWPQAGPAPAQARSVTVSDASALVADRASLVEVAENYVRLQAERQVGVSVDRQRVTRFVKRGTVVVVSLRDTVSNWSSRRTFDVDVTLNEGTWQPLGMHVVTMHGTPPIGVPAPAS